MSYTTQDRYGEVKHAYTNRGDKGYVSGIWWPDFGPLTVDHSDQPFVHPTPTIFRNEFEIPRERSGRIAAERADPKTADTTTSSKQFRRNPSTEAMFKSTIIQPYRKGHHTIEREIEDYQTVAVRTPPTLKKEGQQYACVVSRSASSPGEVILPTSLVRLQPGQRVVEQSGCLPDWVASKTLASRPPDAAGHAGTTRNRCCQTSRDTGSCTLSLASGAGVISSSLASNKAARVDALEELLSPSASLRDLKRFMP